MCYITASCDCIQRFVRNHLVKGFFVGSDAQTHTLMKQLSKLFHMDIPNQISKWTTMKTKTESRVRFDGKLTFDD